VPASQSNLKGSVPKRHGWPDDKVKNAMIRADPIILVLENPPKGRMLRSLLASRFLAVSGRLIPERQGYRHSSREGQGQSLRLPAPILGATAGLPCGMTRAGRWHDSERTGSDCNEVAVREPTCSYSAECELLAFRRHSLEPAGLLGTTRAQALWLVACGL